LSRQPRGTILLLSDQERDIRALLPGFPLSSAEFETAELKEADVQALIPVHPDLVLIDGTTDLAAAEDCARVLSIAWEIGLPPVLLVLHSEQLHGFHSDCGADDFLVTTASTSEISARMSMAARRAGFTDGPTVLKVGDLTINPENYQVYVRGRPLDLTFREFELLKCLAQRPGRVCGRDMLLRDVWGYDYYGGARTVDVHIRRLRAKLGPEHESLIVTVRNVGYRLVPRLHER
jgi:DNA-binding response OmpR family regulator